MLASVSQVIVLVFGAAICVLSVWGMFAPDRLLKFVDSVLGRPQGIYVAVVVRLFLGVALIIAAANSRFPQTFQVLGWITIIAAIGLAIMGWKRLRAFVAWFMGFPKLLIRLWLILGVAFGGFLIYAMN